MSLDLKLQLQQALQPRYRVDREIGRGGMAVVYAGVDTEQRRPVAIKVLLPSLAAHIGVARFLREIELAGTLVHPHILGVLGTGMAGELPYYVMPLLDNESLRDTLQRTGRIPVSQAATIGADVVDALAHAHARGIVHRDIKPENLVLHDGAVLVTDFGVGKALNDAGGSKLTETGFIVGTPLYMSPEQAAGDPGIDGRTDLYSLGVVLYEMLTGAAPFRGRTAQQIIAARFMGPPPSIASEGNFPDDLAALVAGLLALRPADRLADTEAIGRRLRETGARH